MDHTFNGEGNKSKSSAPAWVLVSHNSHINYISYSFKVVLDVSLPCRVKNTADKVFDVNLLTFFSGAIWWNLAGLDLLTQSAANSLDCVVGLSGNGGWEIACFELVLKLAKEANELI